MHETGFDHKGFGAVLNLLRFMELVLDRTSMQKHSGWFVGGIRERMLPEPLTPSDSPASPQKGHSLLILDPTGMYAILRNKETTSRNWLSSAATTVVYGEETIFLLFLSQIKTPQSHKCSYSSCFDFSTKKVGKTRLSPFVWEVENVKVQMSPIADSQHNMTRCLMTHFCCRSMRRGPTGQGNT